MKKIISIALVVLLVFVLSGCENDEPIIIESVADYNECIREYSRNHIWEAMSTKYFCDNEELTYEEYTALLKYEDIFYTQEEVDNLFEELKDILDELYGNNATNCNMIMMARDLLVAFNQGYTFEIDQYGMMHELKDGVYTDDTFTNNDFLEEYCELENID